MSFAVAAVGALMFHTAVGFVVPNLQRSNSKGVQGVQGALPAAKLPEQVAPGWFFGGFQLGIWQHFMRFCVKLEVSTFCFPLLGLLPDLHCCLGQDIEVATGFWQDTLYQLVRWCMALPYWPLLLQDFWLVPSGHQRQRCATMVDSNLWLVTGRGIRLWS